MIFMTRWKGGATTQTASLDWTSNITGSTKLFAGLKRMDLSRDDTVDDQVNDGMVIVTQKLNQKWSASAGISGYNGAVDGIGFLAGAGYRPYTRLALNLEYQNNRPWVDPVDAVLYDGAFDSLKLALDWSNGSRLWVHLEAENKCYELNGASPYGNEPTIQGLVSYMLLADPEIFVGYSYEHSWFNYEYDDLPAHQHDRRAGLARHFCKLFTPSLG